MSNADMNNDLSSAGAVREFVFLVGADLIYQGRKVKVRLAFPKQIVQNFSGAYERSRMACQLRRSWNGRRAETYLRNPATSSPGCHLMFHRPHHLCLRENSTAEFGFNNDLASAKGVRKSQKPL